jgi:8-oxo-dGTP pyrophosphatase MutT (NUDIX family)
MTPRKRAGAANSSAGAGAGKAPAKVPTKTQVSAGGVAFRLGPQGAEAVIVSVGDKRRWQLPKGIVDAGESPETTALRETREEAGVDTELVAPIEVVEYWYFATENAARIRFHKFVHFFLLAYVGGDVQEHDHEVHEARWVPLDEAASLLAFASERRVVERAREMIAGR